MPSFTPIVDALPGELPFTAPERLERDRGRSLELRLGANESVFGVAHGAREAMAAAIEQVAWYGDPESLELRDEIARRHDVWPVAGARIGYALASAATACAFDKVRAHFAVNRIAQAGALASLRDHRFLERVRAGNARGLADYAALGRELNAPTLPSATNFSLFDLGTAERAGAVLAALVERGVFVRKPPVPPLDRCVRVSVGTPDERRRFSDILRDLRTAGVF